MFQLKKSATDTEKINYTLAKLVSRQEKRLAAADEMPTAARMIPLWPQKPVARGCVWKYVEGLIGTKSKNFSV